MGLWFKRLSVAYGLSFPKYDLSDFVLPDDVPIAKRLPQRRAAFNEFVDKDMV
jgi:hypothetical protein